MGRASGDKGGAKGMVLQENPGDPRRRPARLGEDEEAQQKPELAEW